MAAKTGLKQQCPTCEAIVPIKDEGLIGKRIKCPKCGEPFLVEDAEDSAPSKPAKTAKGPANGKGPAAKTKPGAPRQRADEDEDADQPKFKKKKDGNSTKLFLGLGLAGVAVLLLAVAAFFMFNNSGNTDKKSTTTTPTGPARQNQPGPAQVTETPKPAEGGAPVALTLGLPSISNMLPNDTQLVFNIAMKDLLQNPLGQRAFDDAAVSRAFGFPVNTIDQVILARKYLDPGWGFLIVRTNQPIPLEGIKKAYHLKPADGGPRQGQDYFLAPFTWNDLFLDLPEQIRDLLVSNAPLAVRLHDPHTLVLADVPKLQQWLDVKGQPTLKGPEVIADPNQTTPAGPRGKPSPGGRPSAGGPSPDGIADPSQAPTGRGGRGGPNPGGGGRLGGRTDSTPKIGSNNYRTLDEHLKNMLDQMETNAPYLISWAVDLDPYREENIAGVITPFGQFPFPITLGMSFQWTVDEDSHHKTVLMAGAEYKNDKEASDTRSTLDRLIQTISPLLKPAVKVKKPDPNRNAGTPGGPRPGPGARGKGPGGTEIPQPGGPRGPGAGGGPSPGGGGPSPGGGGPRPGGPTPGGPRPGGPAARPGDQTKAPELPAPINLTEDVKTAGRLVLATVDIDLDQSIWDALFKGSEPYFRRFQGKLDMVSTHPDPRRLALAAQKYATEKKQLPRGTVNRTPSAARANRPWPPDQRVSWMADLLPYLGYDHVASRIDPKKSWRDPENRWAASSLIPQFLAPDTPQEAWYVPYPELPYEVAATDYVGMAGIGLDAAMYVASDPAVANKLGVFGYDRVTRLSDVESPAKTIFMIQVPRRYPSPWLAGGGSTIRGVPEKDSFKEFATKRGDGKRGAYTVMTDGSVRWLSDKISDDVFKDLCRIKGAKTELNLDKIAPLEQPELKALPTVPAAPAKPAAPAGK